MSSNENKEYKIGYKCPPVESRFKKGHSGNPKGRPKKVPKTSEQILLSELNSSVEIYENEKHLSFTKLEIIVKQMVNNAMTSKRLKDQLMVLDYYKNSKNEAADIIDPSMLSICNDVIAEKKERTDSNGL